MLQRDPEPDPPSKHQWQKIYQGKTLSRTRLLTVRQTILVREGEEGGGQIEEERTDQNHANTFITLLMWSSSCSSVAQGLPVCSQTPFQAKWALYCGGAPLLYNCPVCFNSPVSGLNHWANFSCFIIFILRTATESRVSLSVSMVLFTYLQLSWSNWEE